MSYDLSQSIAKRIEKIRHLTGREAEVAENVEGAALAQTVLHDTTGGGHPLMKVLADAIAKGDWLGAVAGGRGVVELFDHGALVSPRLAIAHEIEGSVLDIADSQVQAAEKTADGSEIFDTLRLELSFIAEGEVDDPDGRILHTVKKGKTGCSIGIATEADVDTAVTLLKKTWRL